MPDSGAGLCVAPHLKCLRWCGFACMDPGSRQRYRFAHAVYRALVLGCTSFYLLQECVYAYVERNDMEHLAKVMFLLLCHYTSLVKQWVLNLDSERIDRLLASLDDPLFNKTRGKNLVSRCANDSRRLQRVYSGTAVLTCTLWLVFPIANIVHNLPVEFPFWLPIGCEDSRVLVIVLLYSYYVTTLVGVANTTIDAFVGTLLYQCGTQMQLVRIDLETLIKRATEISRSLQEKHESVLMQLFLDCLAHYEKVMDVTEQIQSIFGTAILVQFGIGGWILCMAAYKCVTLSVMSVEFASMTLFIVCILTELFLYCYFGNELTVESGRLTEALYGTWRVGASTRYARAVLIAMERARRPLRVTVGGVMPLSLDTFLKIIKSSYSFYAVIRQTK